MLNSKGTNTYCIAQTFVHLIQGKITNSLNRNIVHKNIQQTFNDRKILQVQYNLLKKKKKFKIVSFKNDT